uniref:PLATZ transcription factor family protein n=1 Tax=Kalanchoe fedtschenkoi TaxID=63787 RepID=A0A7N0USU3_KALFE
METLAEHLQDGKPQWLEDFLAKPYSKPCLLQAHADAGFNTNKFCVDCRTPVCPSCVTEFGHTNHAIIQVYRHVYQDSASVRAIRSFMNINGVQINQNGPIDTPPKRAKHNSRINKVTSSDRKNRIERMCKICGKKLVPAHQFHYCSIQCKLADYMSKSDRSVPPFLMPGTQTLDEACTRGKVDGKEKADEAAATRRRKRKGIPRRAPFF